MTPSAFTGIPEFSALSRERPAGPTEFLYVGRIVVLSAHVLSPGRRRRRLRVYCAGLWARRVARRHSDLSRLCQLQNQSQDEHFRLVRSGVDEHQRRCPILLLSGFRLSLYRSPMIRFSISPKARPSAGRRRAGHFMPSSAIGLPMAAASWVRYGSTCFTADYRRPLTSRWTLLAGAAVRQ